MLKTNFHLISSLLGQLCVWVCSVCLSSLLGHPCSSSSSSSSRCSSSQDRPIGPLPAKCWPEAFHATFIHNIRERMKTERMEQKSLGTTISTTTTTYHHHQAPQLLQMKRWGRKVGGRTSENSVTLSLMLIQISTSNFRRHYQPHAGSVMCMGVWVSSVWVWFFYLLLWDTHVYGFVVCLSSLRGHPCVWVCRVCLSSLLGHHVCGFVLCLSPLLGHPCVWVCSVCLSSFLRGRVNDLSFSII